MFFRESRGQAGVDRAGSLLPLPGTHRGPRHLHSCTGGLQRSVSRMSITDFVITGSLRRLGTKLLCSFASRAAHWSHHTRVHHHTLLLPSRIACICSQGLPLDVGPIVSSFRDCCADPSSKSRICVILEAISERYTAMIPFSSSRPSSSFQNMYARGRNAQEPAAFSDLLWP
jgi:hypothetical protein